MTVDQLVLGLGQRAVIAVAVGRLHHEDIRIDEGRAIADHQRRGLADVARHDQLALARAVAHADLGEGGAHDVAGAAEGHRHRRLRPELDVVRHAVQAQRQRVDVVGRVQRRVGDRSPSPIAARCGRRLPARGRCP